MANRADGTGTLAGGVPNGVGAALKSSGELQSAETMAKLGTRLAVVGGAMSEGYSAVQDHSNGMSWGRSAAIHGTGLAGGVVGGDWGATAGFWAGEALFPASGGIPGAIIGGAIGGWVGSKVGEGAGGAAAQAVGRCR
jgi:hypothetical protein